MTASTTVARAETADRPRAARAPWTRRLPWWLEAVIAVAGYELYDAVQAATSGEIAPARDHGRLVAHAEQHLHIWVEPSINRFATVHSWIGLAAGYYYELAHITVTVAVLVFLWRRRPSMYVLARNALLAVSMLSLLVFWLWPVAPPRLALSDVTDTLVGNNILGAAHVHGGFVNLYAAMPSLHVAWAFWCAGAVVLAARNRWRHLAWLYPVTTTLAVVSTANHYLLDAVAGAALSAVALLVVRRYARRVPTADSAAISH